MIDPNAEERAAIEAALLAEREDVRSDGLGSELVVARRPIEILPAAFAIVLALVLARLSPPLGLVLFVTTAALLLRHGRTRVGAVAIGPGGDLTFGRHGAVSFRTLRRVEVALLDPPLWSYTRELGRAAGATLGVRFYLPEGREIVLARGHVFRKAPRRAVHPSTLSRWLRGRAEEAGMKVRNLSGDEWVAER